MRGHEWVQVRHRRWCLTCGRFQTRYNAGSNWRPTVRSYCAWSSPYAERKLLAEGTLDPMPPGDGLDGEDHWPS